MDGSWCTWDSLPLPVFSPQFYISTKHEGDKVLVFDKGFFHSSVPGSNIQGTLFLPSTFIPLNPSRIIESQWVKVGSIGSCSRLIKSRWVVMVGSMMRLNSFLKITRIMAEIILCWYLFYYHHHLFPDQRSTSRVELLSYINYLNKFIVSPIFSRSRSLYWPRKIFFAGNLCLSSGLWQLILMGHLNPKSLSGSASR